MSFKGFLQKLAKGLRKNLFNDRWRCIVCGKEIFDGSCYCEECYNSLPFNDGTVCAHCGRKVLAFEEYCSTCKGVLVSLDKCRSVYNYAPPISALIKRAKYNNRKYVLDSFSEDLANLYLKNYFNADYLTFVPMSKKAERRRGYNQSKVLCEKVSQRVCVPVFYGIEKIKETERQAKLGRDKRLKNLKDAFHVSVRKDIKDKAIVIVDDVSTTGSTGEALASKLKRAGAKKVSLITVASVPPIEKY